MHATFLPEDLAALQVTGANAEAYCAAFEAASLRLWEVTNGQHYFESVEFGYGGVETDVLLKGPGRANANADRVHMHYGHALVNAEDTFVDTLVHEWGHYFYHLADEYLETGKGMGEAMGMCMSSSAPSLQDCTSFPGSSCSTGARCIRHRACTGGTYDGLTVREGEDTQGKELDEYGWVSPDQCLIDGGGTTYHTGVCVLHGTDTLDGGLPEDWPNWGKACASHFPDCNTPGFDHGGKCTDQIINVDGGSGLKFVCQDGNGSCIMSGKSLQPARWCDGTSHVHEDFEAQRSLSNSPSVRAYAWEKDLDSPEDYNCWDQAKGEWGQLQFAGEYEADLGTPPNYGDPAFCTWNVPDYDDLEALDDWSIVVVDASGSMGADLNGTAGIVYALNGAEYFNQVAVATEKQAGVYAFGDDYWPVQWAEVVGGIVEEPEPGTQELVLGDPVDLAPQSVDLYRQGVYDYVTDVHQTHLCEVFEGIAEAFESADAPTGDREVVLLTDANFNDEGPCPDQEEGAFPYLGGYLEEFCDEHGVKLDVILTGDDPNVSYGILLANACDGWHLYAGDEQEDGGSLQHSIQVTTALARSMVAGQQIALHERAPLVSTTAVEERVFAVPPGATTLEVAWLGSPYGYTFTRDGVAYDQAFDALDFELESPSGVVYTPAFGDSEQDALYRRYALTGPEPGVWTARVDKQLLPENLRPEVDVGWIASIARPGLRAATWLEKSTWSVGEPLPIFGAVHDGEFALGSLAVQARVSGGGQTWEVDLHDDGRHHDGAADDGVYGGPFTPLVQGPYSVKTSYELQPGTSYTIPGESIFGPGPSSQVLQDEGTLLAHTSFEARAGEVGRVRASLPPLQTGWTQWRLSATIEGVLVPIPDLAVSLGEGVDVLGLEVECMNCRGGSDPIDAAEAIYELRFAVSVAPDAPLGARSLLVEIGEADYSMAEATSVVAGDLGLDTDGDGIPDAADDDDDGDGLFDWEEGHEDSDGDGIEDALDADSDGDGDLDGVDPDPLDATSVGRVVVGDFDGDGVQDLARGEPEHAGSAGRLSVTYGATGATEAWDRDADGILDAALPGDRFGHSVTVGDFDGDGFDDLAIGVPGDDVAGITNGGSVHVLYGAAGGLSAAGDQVWHSGSPGVEGTVEGDDGYGQVLAAGDFDCDGTADLAVGVPREDIGPTTDGGFTNVLYGSAGGLSSVDDVWYQGFGGVDGVAEPFDSFGGALATGNFDAAASCDDLAISAPRENLGPIADVGWVYVIYGTAAGLATDDDFSFFQSSPGFADSSEPGDRLGRRFWVEDRDEDGHDDLTAYVPGEPSCAEPGERGFHVVYGGSSGLSAEGNGLECLEAYQQHQ